LDSLIANFQREGGAQGGIKKFLFSSVKKRRRILATKIKEGVWSLPQIEGDLKSVPSSSITSYLDT